jgi:hypothetical protein
MDSAVFVIASAVLWIEDGRLAGGTALIATSIAVMMTEVPCLCASVSFLPRLCDVALLQLERVGLHYVAAAVKLYHKTQGESCAAPLTLSLAA